MTQTIKVSEFGLAPREQHLCYPGKRASGSYVFLGDEIELLSGKGVGIKDLSTGDNRLGEIFDDLDERYMIVGYGSNASPAQLRHKFTGTGSKMPVLRGSLKDCDAVYRCKPASYGSVPATITGSEGTVVEAWANVLDTDQLDTMNDSEGSAYWLARINCSFKLDSGESFSPVYTYIAKEGPLLIDGLPVRLAEVRASGTNFQEKRQPEILDYLSKKTDPECDAPGFVSKTKTGAKSGGLEFDILGHGDLPPPLSKMKRAPCTSTAS